MSNGQAVWITIIVLLFVILLGCLFWKFKKHAMAGMAAMPAMPSIGVSVSAPGASAALGSSGTPASQRGGYPDYDVMQPSSHLSPADLAYGSGYGTSHMQQYEAMASQ